MAEQRAICVIQAEARFAKARFRARNSSAPSGTQGTVIHAERVFARRRRSGAKPPADKTPSNVRPLAGRITLDDESIAVVLFKTERIDHQIFFYFTIVRAPRFPDEEARFLAPFRMRKWDTRLFSAKDAPRSPAIVYLRPGRPYETLDQVLAQTDPATRAVIMQEGVRFVYVPKP